jgi:hypothetical protein
MAEWQLCPYSCREGSPCLLKTPHLGVVLSFCLCVLCLSRKILERSALDFQLLRSLVCIAPLVAQRLQRRQRQRLQPAGRGTATETALHSARLLSPAQGRALIAYLRRRLDSVPEQILTQQDLMDLRRKLGQRCLLQCKICVKLVSRVLQVQHCQSRPRCISR